MSFIQTDSFGEPGGYNFEMQRINSIGLKTGHRVDHITINGIQHGGSGGNNQTEILHFDEDEYISQIIGRSGGEIDQLNIVTNKGRTIAGGGNGGNPNINLDNIRVIAIGGMSGKYVDMVKIKYIKDYVESKIQENDTTFILSYSPPGSELVESQLESSRTVEAYEKITQNMIRQTYSASVQGEYFGRVSAAISATSSLEIEDISIEKINDELTNILENQTKHTYKIPDNKVGIKMVKAKIMKDGEKEKYWIFPTGAETHIIINIDNVESISDCFDLTGTLFRQMTKPIPNKNTKYGYLYYPSI